MQLNGTLVAVLLVATTTAVAGAAADDTAVWAQVVAGVLAAALVSVLARGAWRAERARHFGCW